MTARIYVGTYAKYNGGSIAGKWLDLEDYADKEEFLKAAAELHKDEADPELMYQDFEGFPRGFYNESSINEKLWDWLDLSHDDRELLAVYQDHVNAEADIDDAREAFEGRYDRKLDWAYDRLDSSGEMDSIPEHLQHYFDYDRYIQDFDANGWYFIRHDGDVWVFRPI